MVYSNQGPLIDISDIYQNMQEAAQLKRAASQVGGNSKTSSSVIQNISQNIIQHEKEYIMDCVTHPEKLKTWKLLARNFRKLNPKSFKKIRQIILKIQYITKHLQQLTQACKTHQVEMDEYREFMHEFGYKVHGSRNDINEQTFSTPIIKAVALNNPKMVKVLHELGADLTMPDHDNMTPIKNAIGNNDKSMVSLLIQLGVGINTADNLDWTPLSYAIAIKNYDMVDFLCTKHKAKLNEIHPNGNTALIQAIDSNDINMVRLLIKLGADVNVGKDHSPLHAAINICNDAMIRLLIKKEADIEALNSLGRTPLSEAIMMGVSRESIELLKLAGADQELSQKIKTNVELAHIWGIGNSIKIAHKGREINLSLETMPPNGAMKMLTNFVDDFFEDPAFDSTSLSPQAQLEIREAIHRAYPCSNEPAGLIAEDISAGKPYVIEAGTPTHAVTFVFCKGKLIVCNRGEGREKLACEIYHLPGALVTPQLIDNFKQMYPDVKSLKKMLAELKLELEDGYQQQDQKVGNCSWVSGKAAVGVLFRQYASTKDEGQKLYKAFTAYTREKSLENYLKLPFPPEKSQVQYIRKKAHKKGLPRAKELLDTGTLKREFKL